MSRFAKSDAYNSLKDARTGSLGLPAGTTSERDPVPAAGEIRWNTSNSRLEFFNGSSWSEVSARGNVTITKDSFTGDGSTAVYVLSITPTSANNILVFVGNVYQEPSVNFTLVGATLTFISAPPTATNIVVLHGFDSTGNTTPPPVGNNTIGVSDEGGLVLAAAQAINFIGAGVTAVDAGSGVVNVTVSGGGGGGSALTVQDEGVSLSTAATKLNFVGAGVTVSEPVADEILITIENFMDINVSIGGRTFVDELLYQLKTVTPFSLPPSLTGSYAIANIGPEASTIFSFRKNGVEFATAEFTTTTGSYTSASGASFALGDVFTIHGPTNPDATLADISFTLKGRIT